MPPSLMDGIRSWKFVVDGVGTLELEDTDFWIDYQASGEGNDEPELSLALQSVWQHSDFASPQGLARRVFMEDRLKELKWDFVTKKGTLTIDEGTAEERELTDITLRDVLTTTGDFNDLIEYTLVFGFPLSTNTGSGGLEIARSMRFVPFPHNLAADSEDLLAWIQNDGPTIVSNLNIDPEGNLTVDQVQDNSATLFQSVEQNAPINGELFQFEASVYVRKSILPPNFPGIRFAISGNTLIETQYTIDHQTLSPGPRLLLRSGQVAADFAEITDVHPEFYRVVLRLTNTDVLNTTLEIELLPAVAVTFVNTWSSSVTGESRFWRGHLGLADSARDVGAPSNLTGPTPGDLTAQSIKVDAQNFIVERGKEDLTQFKEVFRAAPIRVRGSLGTESMSVQAIKQLTAGATDLARRQNAAALVQVFVDKVSLDGVLLIDEGDANQQQFTAHLESVSPGELDLPDAVTYSLEFVLGFVGGLN